MYKLFFQSLAAFIIVGAGFRFEIPFLQFQDMPMLSAIIGGGITFLWIIGIINAINLMDGMDGLAAGQLRDGFGGDQMHIVRTFYESRVVFVYQRISKRALGPRPPGQRV